MTNSTTRKGLALAVILASFAGTGHAQDNAADDFNDFTMPDMSAPEAEREYDVCPDREPRPEWAQNLDVHDSYKDVLLMRIYEARSYEAIVTTGDCSCANRVPSWDLANAEYQENFALLDPQAQRSATRKYRRLKDDHYSDARAICEAQGNW
jgi:hypothetical protein